MTTLNLKFWSSKTLPAYIQTEVSECGLACLAMVSTYWGRKTDIYTMRRNFSFSVKGATLRGLIDIAKQIGFETRPVQLDLVHLPDLKLPSILHWDMNHFVVLKSVGYGKVVIHDPASGERNMSMDEFSKHFTGVALELTVGASFEKKDERRKFSVFELMGSVTGLKRSLTQLVALGIAMQICVLAMPFYTQWLVDEALVASDRDLISVLGMGFVALVLVQGAISAIRSWITAYTAANLNFQWLSNAFSHLMKLPISYFEKRHLGDIVSRFGSIKTIQNTLTTQFVEAVIDGMLVIVTLGAMSLYSGQLTIIACVTVCLYVALRLAIFRKIKDATVDQITYGAKQQNYFYESARGVQAIRIFAKSEDRRVGWTNSLADEFNAGIRLSKLSITYQTANFILFNVERVLILWLAGLAVIDSKFSVGMLFAFIAYKDQFSARTAALIDKVFEFKMLHVHSERVADVVLSEVENDSSEVELDAEQITPEIEFKKVSFRYSASEPFILKDLSFKIPQGQFVAITGPSGGGKSTLLKLLLGLLDPVDGQILVGGIDIRKVGLKNYRKLLGVVMQDDTLFSGSIADNISFFDSAADQERIAICANMASIHAEISSMPMRYNTLVGSTGSGLSGGQVQRILLARAFYSNPKILVLDEATSNLDVGNEKMVNAAITQSNFTRIVVAHRPETISLAQRILVLHGGNIVHDVMPGQPSKAAATPEAPEKPKEPA